MDSSIREWLNLSVRWIHVFAAIMWVGQTYYFTWLDGQFAKLEKKAAADGTAPAVWMVLSGRAAYIHMGAIFGTIMVANVWSCILPTQRRMLAAAAAGEKFDASLGAQAKLRSKHNTFLAVPAVFLMLSNHFPVATYGNRFGWEIMLGLVVAGWIAAKLIREF